MSEIERRYESAREVIQEWVKKQGHERCWYYPELFERLVEIFEIKQTSDRQLPPREEFEKGCKIYQDEQYKT
jgi:predicted ATPase